MNLKQLRDALSSVLKEMEDLDAKTVDEKGQLRSFSDAEKAQYDELVKKAGEIRSAIERAEARAEAERTVERLNSVNSSTEIVTLREENCNEKGEYRGFRSLGEQLQSVQRAERGQVDKRLDDLNKHYRAAAAGMNQTVDSDGGFLVQTDFLAAMQKEAITASTVASFCAEYQVSSASNAVEFPLVKEDSRADGSRNGGVQAYWTSEAGSMTATKPQFELQRLTLEKLTALAYVTDEMLQDAAFLSSWVSQQYADEHSFKVDAAIIEGDGAGKPFGIFNSAALVEVAKKSGQAADTVVAENITTMFSRLIPAAKSRAVWLINYEVEAQLPLMTIGDQPVYLPPGGLAGNQYGLLLGRPVIVAEACEKLGDKGDIILADLSKYMLAKKGGLQSDTSIHVKFLTNETAFRFITRINGQPMLRTAITPYKGNSNQKLSYFVTVAARA